MIIRLKIKREKGSEKQRIVVWIQRHQDVENDVQQLFQFFKDQMVIEKTRRILPYYRVSSENLLGKVTNVSDVQEIIPEIYFCNEDSVEFEETITS